MIMSYIWTGMVLLSVLCAAATGNQAALSASVLDGAQSGIALALSIAGALCLWSGVGRVLEKGDITALLARWMKPLLQHLFPSSRDDSALAGSLSGNLCANLLGLGNAATPMG
ncbi:MAG: spore maturation protein A, partial [Firmicutes bacterium]|nr:spore maturation protein A [Bacillota bacterium]